MRDAVREAARRDPAHAPARRERLRERADVQHPAFGVERLRGRPSLRVEMQLRVDIVLDERQTTTRDELDERTLALRAHRAAQRVLEIGHHPACLRPVLHDRRVERIEVDAVAGIGRDLDCSQAQPLERLQAGVEARRLDDHGVAGRACRGQAEVERFHRAVRDDDLVGRELHAVEQVAQRDLATQLQAAGRELVDRAPRVHARRRAREHAAELLEREQQRARERGTERHHVARHRRAQDVEHHRADLDRSRAAVGRRRLLGRRRTRARLRRNVVARARARLDQPACFEQVIRLEHRGRAHPPGGARPPHRRQLVAGLQQAAADRRRDVGCERFVTLHGRRGRQETLAPESDPVFSTNSEPVRSDPVGLG